MVGVFGIPAESDVFAGHSSHDYEVFALLMNRSWLHLHFSLGSLLARKSSGKAEVLHVIFHLARD